MNSAVAVEFLGTALLAAAVAFTGNPTLVVAALAVALGFGAKVSGGHFNPAVTILQYLAGKVGQTKALSYIAAQVAAAGMIFGLSRYV